jgi:hypothetical protein
VGSVEAGASSAGYRSAAQQECGWCTEDLLRAPGCPRAPTTCCGWPASWRRGAELGVLPARQARRRVRRRRDRTCMFAEEAPEKATRRAGVRVWIPTCACLSTLMRRCSCSSGSAHRQLWGQWRKGWKYTARLTAGGGGGVAAEAYGKGRRGSGGGGCRTERCGS